MILHCETAGVRLDAVYLLKAEDGEEEPGENG